MPSRKTLTRVFETIALAVVALDLVLYFAIARPLGAKVKDERRALAASEGDVERAQAHVRQMAKFRAAMPGAEDELKSFLRSHVPSRRRAFSHVSRLVRKSTDDSGLELTGISYRLESSKDDPLVRLALEMSVEGPFSNLMKFAHGLESAGDLILVRDFTFEPGEGPTVTLRLTADLFLTP